MGKKKRTLSGSLNLELIKHKIYGRFDNFLLNSLKLLSAYIVKNLSSDRTMCKSNNVINAI